MVVKRLESPLNGLVIFAWFGGLWSKWAMVRRLWEIGQGDWVNRLGKKREEKVMDDMWLFALPSSFSLINYLFANHPSSSTMSLSFAFSSIFACFCRVLEEKDWNCGARFKQDVLGNKLSCLALFLVMSMLWPNTFAPWSLIFCLISMLEWLALLWLYLYVGC